MYTSARPETDTQTCKRKTKTKNIKIVEQVLHHTPCAAIFMHTCSVIQPRCFTIMPGCMLLISSFTRGKRLAAPAWIPLYQDWAMAGSFARRNTEFFLLDEITSKYLADEMRERESGAIRETKRRWKKGAVREIKDTWQKREKLEGEEHVSDINKENM